MPCLVKLSAAVYQYFGASVVLDPCSGKSPTHSLTHSLTHVSLTHSLPLLHLAGWGDRLLGASAAPNVRTYIGFDPNKGLRPGYAQLMQASVGASVTSLTASSLRLSNSFQVLADRQIDLLAYIH